MYILRALVAFCAILAVVRAQPACTPSQTPTDIETKFLQGCSQQNLPETTCQSAWTNFSNAFQSIDPADVMASDYASYFNLIPINVGESQSLFWSGTQDLVSLISCMTESGINVVSSSNTPSAGIINSFYDNDTNWCGRMGGSIDYNTSCPCNPVTQFWSQFSLIFAEAARGTIFYVGNGERVGGTYNEQGFFATVEIPNLNRERVTSAVVIVVHRQGRGESCGQGTLSTLENTLTRDFEYTCYDVYGDLSQTQALSDCASRIIQAEQDGTEPAANNCFSKEDSGAQGMTSAKTGLLLIATLLLSLVFCLNT